MTVYSSLTSRLMSQVQCHIPDCSKFGLFCQIFRLSTENVPFHVETGSVSNSVYRW